MKKIMTNLHFDPILHCSLIYIKNDMVASDFISTVKKKRKQQKDKEIVYYLHAYLHSNNVFMISHVTLIFVWTFVKFAHL